jgi:hypothetical protein
LECGRHVLQTTQCDTARHSNRSFLLPGWQPNRSGLHDRPRETVQNQVTSRRASRTMTGPPGPRSKCWTGGPKRYKRSTGRWKAPASTENTWLLTQRKSARSPPPSGGQDIGAPGTTGSCSGPAALGLERQQVRIMKMGVGNRADCYPSVTPERFLDFGRFAKLLILLVELTGIEPVTS